MSDLMHNSVIKHFKSLILSGVLTKEHADCRKKAIKIEDVKYYGYYLNRDDVTWFLPNEGIEDLPIKVGNFQEVDYRGDVFNYIKKYTSVKIPDKQQMEFKELTDSIGNFKHIEKTNLHFTLYKIITLAGFCDRVNYRIIAPAGFGKDCAVNNLIDLGCDVSNIYGATYAKLEYSLKFPFLIFNEMGNLKKEDKENMQNFLLAAGAFMNSYTKKSRKSEGTQEIYDISNTSLGILYNPPEYYMEKGQEYFDMMFQPAVINRFIPFKFDGVINVPNISENNSYEKAKEYLPDYKKIISTLNYYRNCQEIVNENVTDGLDDSIEFNKYEERYKRSFETISKYIALYSSNNEEFHRLTLELYKCFINYKEEMRKLMGEIKYE